MGSVKGSARSGIWDLVVQWVLVAVPRGRWHVIAPRAFGAEGRPEAGLGGSLGARAAWRGGGASRGWCGCCGDGRGAWGGLQNPRVATGRAPNTPITPSAHVSHASHRTLTLRFRTLWPRQLLYSPPSHYSSSDPIHGPITSPHSLIPTHPHPLILTSTMSPHPHPR